MMRWQVHPQYGDRESSKAWSRNGSPIGQLIRDANKVKWLEFAHCSLESGVTFHSDIFSNECLISLQSYRCTCFRRVDEPTKWKPKPKHPLKVHVWEGISCHGATKVCIFDDIMNADLFCNVTEMTLVPFIRNKLLDHPHLNILRV